MKYARDGVAGHEIMDENLAKTVFSLVDKISYPLSEPAVLLLDDYPTMNRGQRVLFFFEGQNQTPFAVMKCSGGKQAHRISWEHQTLQRLRLEASNQFGSKLPRAVRFTEIGGVSLLLETFLEGRSIYYEMRNSLFPQRLVSQHLKKALDWLIQFQTETLRRKERLSSSLRRSIIDENLRQVENEFGLAVDEQKMIAHARQLAVKLDGVELPVVARHGDFWPRNLVLEEERAGVVDWEHFQREDLPFEDLFLFPTSYGLVFPWRVARWGKPAEAFRATFLERTWMSDLVRSYFQDYCRSWDLPQELLELFFPVFLGRQMIKEKARKAEEIKMSSIDPWREVFREYAQTGGSICFRFRSASSDSSDMKKAAGP
jgi:hypothetical protein